MQQVKTLLQYNDLVRQAKENGKIQFTNFYLGKEQLDRYIEKGRLYYQIGEWGIAFFCDEESYYQCIGYFNLLKPVVLEKCDKKVLFRILYKEDRVEKNMVIFEKQLSEIGFSKVDMTRQYVLEPKKRMERYKKLYQASKKILESKGFVIESPTQEDAFKIREVLYGTDILKDFHYTYKDDEEIKRDIAEGAYLCVKDADGNICAVNRVYVRKGMAEADGIAIVEAYKKHGFSVAISTKRYLLLNQRGDVEKVQGWIIDTNLTSIKYHTDLGWEKTNRCANEWIWECR